MTKRDFLKASAATTVAALVTAPGFAAPEGHIAIVQPHLPGADAFARRERAAGAMVLIPDGDALRWQARTLRPILRGRAVVGYTDAAHAVLIAGCLDEQGYRRTGRPTSRPGGALLWQAKPRAA
jgi:hypothetical protein